MAEGHALSEHRDAFRRLKRINRENYNHDHFVRSYDGRLDLLLVQVVDLVALPNEPSLEWVRVPMSTKTTPLNKVLYWTWSSTQPGSKAHRICEDPYLDVAWKWIPSCMAMLLLFCFPQNVGGETRNNGFYDPVRDKDRYYSKAARNPCEDSRPQGARSTNPQMNYEEHELLLNPSPANIDQDPQHINSRSQDKYLRLTSRPLRPRKLCFLVENGAPREAPEQSFDVCQGDNSNAEYVFISYTRTEFCVETDIDPVLAIRDRRELLRFAVAATRAAGVHAFWIDFKCVVTDKANVEETGNVASGDANGISEDVYRICDVVRGAHSMVVINGPPYQKKQEFSGEEDRKGWLFLWASRMWVLPELLLAPTEHRIRIYTRAPGISPEDVEPEEVAKRNLAARSCSDAEDVRQLIDHYEGTVQLSQLELVQLALDCLQRRAKVGRTNADLAYALKGLLRRRPEVVENESGFEAFASLSLANDSQRLLERLICMLPPDPDADWSDMRDAWRMQLWDIEPTCQIAGIVDDRTVLLDGAYGASIQWNRLETVAFIKRETASRTVGKICVRGAPIFFSFGVLSVATSRDLKIGTNPILIIGAIALAFSLLTILVAPYLLMKIYLGKFWSTQAWFFGVEGAIDDLAKVERALFGFSENRLTWSANGSLLSTHHLNRFRECEAKAPLRENIRDVASKIAFAPERNTDGAKSPPVNTTTQSGPAGSVHQTNATGQPSENDPVPRQKQFTLIDTYTMTATMFYAYHPPTTVLICGQEGGMQRAVLCSYDWKTQTYCRETVLRMKTLVLERMFRVDRFRFALKRH